MTYDASSRKDIRAAEKSAARTDRDRLEFLTAALGTIQGRTWFWSLLSDCQMFTLAPTFDSPKDYFQLGQRNVGMRIFAEIMSNCPDQYITMSKEANVRSSLTAARQQSRSPEPDRGDPGSDPDADADGTGDPFYDPDPRVDP
jgi:hypothetical protein